MTDKEEELFIRKNLQDLLQACDELILMSKNKLTMADDVTFDIKYMTISRGEIKQLLEMNTEDLQEAEDKRLQLIINVNNYVAGILNRDRYLVHNMERCQEIIEAGHSIRAQNKIRGKQPLRDIKIAVGKDFYKKHQTYDLKIINE